MIKYNIGRIRKGKGVFLGAAAALVFSAIGQEGVLADESVVYVSGDGYEDGGYDWENPLNSIYAAQELLPEGGTIVVTGTFYIDSDREYYLNDGITIQAFEELEGPIFEIAEGGSLVLDNMTIVGNDYFPISNGGTLYLNDSVSFIQWDEEIAQADGVDTWDGAVTYLNGEVLEAFGGWEEETPETEYVETEVVTETEYVETEAVTETEYVETEAVTEPEYVETEAITEPEAVETEAVTETEAIETEAVTEPETVETEAVTETEMVIETEVVKAQTVAEAVTETEAAPEIGEPETETLSMDAVIDEIEKYIVESEIIETEAAESEAAETEITETEITETEMIETEVFENETEAASDLALGTSNAAGSTVLVGIGITTDLSSPDEGEENEVSSNNTTQNNTGSTDSTSANTETEPATGESSSTQSQTEAVQTTGNSSSQSAAHVQQASPVNTGDNSNVWMLAVLGMAALAVMSGSVVMKKKVQE